MIKIILNESRFYLTDDHASLLNSLPEKKALLVFTLTPQKILDLLDLMLISEIDTVIIAGDVAENLNLFKNTFPLILAAGGVVYNAKDELLFIFRRGKWDLPKGKLDPGEDLPACALREVTEETGVDGLSIVRPICTSYHIYLEGEYLLKETHWYLMISAGRYLKPQKSEGITKALWVHKNNIHLQLGKTYETVVDIFKLLSK
ncbi:MAG: NUDIX hydrolase [Chitinophagaceae bacterium]|nr:NUDIX hydrolase [Chitinophagaceae bacterium]